MHRVVNFFYKNISIDWFLECFLFKLNIYLTNFMVDSISQLWFVVRRAKKSGWFMTGSYFGDNWICLDWYFSLASPVHNRVKYFLFCIWILLLYSLYSLLCSCFFFGATLFWIVFFLFWIVFLTDVIHSWASAGPNCIIQRLCYSPMVSMLFSMTLLFVHKVAQLTKWRFLPKNLSQLVIFVIGLTFIWVWGNKNRAQFQ